MENKEYKLDTIQDIANAVNVDNVENFVKDFRAFLLGYISAQVMLDHSNEKAGEPKQPIPIENFKWIDDGVVDAKITLSAKDSEDSIEIRLKQHICTQTGKPCGTPCSDECPVYETT